MKSLNDIVEEFVKVEVELEKANHDNDLESIDAEISNLSSLITEFGKLVGLDTSYMRKFARERRFAA